MYSCTITYFKYIIYSFNCAFYSFIYYASYWLDFKPVASIQDSMRAALDIQHSIFKTVRTISSKCAQKAQRERTLNVM